MAEDQKDQGIVDKAKGTAGDIAGKAAGTASDLAGKAAETASGLVEKAEPLVGKAKEATGDLSSKAEPVLDKARVAAGDLVEKAQPVVDKAVEAGRRSARQGQGPARRQEGRCRHVRHRHDRRVDDRRSGSEDDRRAEATDPTRLRRRRRGQRIHPDPDRGRQGGAGHRADPGRSTASSRSIRSPAPTTWWRARKPPTSISSRRAPSCPCRSSKASRARSPARCCCSSRDDLDPARRRDQRRRRRLVPRALALLVRFLLRPRLRAVRHDAGLQRRPAGAGRDLADAPPSRHRGPHLRGGGLVPPPGRRGGRTRSVAGRCRAAHDPRTRGEPLGAERERDRADAVHPDLDHAVGARPRARRRAEGLHDRGPHRHPAAGDLRRRR